MPTAIPIEFGPHQLQQSATFFKESGYLRKVLHLTPAIPVGTFNFHVKTAHGMEDRIAVTITGDGSPLIVEEPLRLYVDPDRVEDKMWHFPSYNVTLRNFWSPFLVNYTEEHDIFKLYLDIPDVGWVNEVQEYDIAVVSTGYWYHRKILYHVDNTVFGASPQAELNVTTIETPVVIGIALANVLKYMTMEYEGIVMLRTVTVDHYENGTFVDGGSCKRMKPFSQQDGGIPTLNWMNKQICKVQVEEFQKAMAYAKDTSKLKLLNVTYSAFLRPDGHPGQYRVRNGPEDPVNDCLHWCLPGPVDLWNQFVLHSIQATFR